MSVNYAFSQNTHTVSGPRAALPVIFPTMPTSVLDVGSGPGTWATAARECGVSEIIGIDAISSDAPWFHYADLTQPIRLGRTFDAVLCLEVGEHLHSSAAPTLVQSLVRHSDCVVFSAACPGQPGQHHVNCQWPDYWQHLFNREGFACDDAIRWQLWDMTDVEPWYRQNIFIARRATMAGLEQRIRPVLHPDMLPFFAYEANQRWTADIEYGALPVAWYLKAPATALMGKVQRRIRYARLTEQADYST